MSKLGGTKNEKKKIRLIERDGLKCAYCGRRMDYMDLTIDHKKPVGSGGSLTDLSNMVLACHQCNCRKGVLGLNGWLEYEKARLLIEKRKVRFTRNLVKNLEKGENDS